MSESYLYYSTGNRDYQEDRFALFKDKLGRIVIIVLDGHSGHDPVTCGDMMAFFLNKVVYKFKRNAFKLKKMEKYIKNVNDEILSKKRWREVGACFVMVVIDSKKNKVYTLNAGDSRAYLYNNNRRDISLTRVFQPEYESISWLRDMIRQGKVFVAPGESCYRLGGQVNLTAGIGDEVVARICEDYKRVHTSTTKFCDDDWIIMGSDGLFLEKEEHRIRLFNELSNDANLDNVWHHLERGNIEHENNTVIAFPIKYLVNKLSKVRKGNGISYKKAFDNKVINDSNSKHEVVKTFERLESTNIGQSSSYESSYSSTSS